MTRSQRLPICLISLHLASAPCARGAEASGPQGVKEGTSVMAQPKSEPPNQYYHGNRAPLLPSPLVKLPIGAIHPQGWLRTQLALEADGFSGRLTELSEFLRKDKNAWLNPEGEGERGWEEVPYWLKGFGDLGYVLGDERIIAEARIWIEGALATQRPDGYFGPRSNLTGIKVKRDGREEGRPDLWPHMIMLNALQSWYEYSGDKRVLELMTKFFRWEREYPEEDFLLPFWQQQRAADNLASVYWLYNITGEPWLLELAEKIHRRTANWTERVANWHGVNIAQAFRGPGVYYQQSGDRKHLDAVWQRIADIWGVYGQVPGGGYASDENCRPGYTGPRQGTETCTWAELMLSYEMLLKIDGDPRWADRCEDVAFNSLPASMTADLKGLRYLTCPNMVLADRQNHSPGIENGGEMLSYNPHRYRCCQHNVAHAWPYYAEHLWMATGGNGLAAVLYAPCEVKAKVGDGVEVRIVEETEYPFDETIRFTVHTPKTVKFPLHMRVPSWCRKTPSVKLNGAALSGAAQPAIRARAAARGPDSPGYLVVERAWQDGDTVELVLPMAITTRVWAKQDNSVSIDRGPLTYALKIGEKYVPYEGTRDAKLAEQWPACEVHPATPWNYGLVVDLAAPEKSFKLLTRAWDGVKQPFEAEAAPLALEARARRIPNWKLDPQHKLVGQLQPSPAASTEPEETVTLIPMGCARLRIASFPTVVAAGGYPWVYREPPNASHYFDNITALSDGKLPAASGDQSVPRFTWWDHKGTTEWVQYNFDPARKFSSAAVYWFDDTGLGLCRVPAAWRILHRVRAHDMGAGLEWQPVELLESEAYACAKDKLNRVRFKPVETTGLRLEVQLQPNFSGGILEWQVE
ncbi:MAG: beta-L-arabinofuranosidase domain-containing protein [Planctomycetota bacterium]